MTTRPKTAISCSKCSKYWTGLTTAHCGKCHHTFTGITAFDLHRVGPPGGSRSCAAPDSVLDQAGAQKLVPVTKIHWTGWGRPGEDSRWD